MDLTVANKTRLLGQLVALLESELETLVTSVRAAHEAATHAESRPENKYDTRGLEASYLAGAQKERAGELQAMVATMKAFVPRSYQAHEAIGAGALVGLQSDGRRSCVMLVPAGAGFRLDQDGVTVMTVTPLAPLGRALIGKRVGDELTVHDKDYEIVGLV